MNWFFFLNLICSIFSVYVKSHSKFISFLNSLITVTFCILFAGTLYVMYGEEYDMLPELPFEKPAAFQIFESDSKINPAMSEQLRMKFFECQLSTVNDFINENLGKILTKQVAALFSWTGNQGTVPVSKFNTMKILIGLFNNYIAQIMKWAQLILIFLLECARTICGSNPRKTVPIIKQWFSNAKDATKQKKT